MITECLRLRARHQPEQVAYSFLQDGNVSDCLTYAALDRRARAVAAELRALGASGTVLLLYPCGLDFIAAFFGCLYAGVTAVPLFRPRRNRSDPRFAAIIADSRARIGLTTSDVLRNIEHGSTHHPDLTSLHCVATDGLAGQPRVLQSSAIAGEAPAYLQYTSGSTSTPKGVIVSHAGLMHTLADLDRGLRHAPDTVMVSWLPLFHDLGLIYGIMQPLYSGFPCYVLDPAAFLQRPLRWLEAMSRYGGTHSAAPNFAFELCVQSVRQAEKDRLDLRRWQVALNAAEPVREETMLRFAATFAPCGFDMKAFCPGYGLAESTLKVTAARSDDEPRFLRVHAEALLRGDVVEAEDAASDARTLVGCGVSEIGARIAIVDPKTLKECAAGRVGEIWVSGESVAQGYWQRPQETQATFAARLAETDEGPFLRTGDLGFLHAGELFITGRLKDVIIVRGMNHYPQDIELTMERCHPALRPGCGAAFVLDIDGEERLVVAQEVERTRLRNVDIDEVIQVIRAAVTQEHDLTVHAVALLRPASIPKTSSGKIQRRACCQDFLSGGLKLVAQWQQPRVPAALGPIAPATGDEPRSAEAIEQWILDRLTERLNVPPSQLDASDQFVTFGLDSLNAVRLSGELEEWLGRKLSPTVVFEHPTPKALARFLASGLPDPRPIAAFRPDNERMREPIAVIGIACRFPGAPNPESFWRALSAGADSVAAAPKDRWNGQTFEGIAVQGSASPPGTRPGHFLDAIDQFDAEFFGLAPREAQSMDPQQRLLLEVAWEAMEDAGQVDLAGSPTGVFVGISSSDYSRLLFRRLDQADAYYGTGGALSIAANRLSYLLDLRGPSWAVDTACSSSLVAVHNACQALRLGECDLAFAGGVNLVVSPELTVALAEARMLSSDGRCKAFDADADGYGRGEGCGMVVLKRRSDALRDGDDILALIVGSAVNQDGRSNGLTAPNGLAQQDVIRRALGGAGIEPSAVSYVETHGTGTPLGDPIEVDALKAVFSRGRAADQPCWFGSVKANIGHLEAAAGIAGLIKVVLSLRHGELPPHINLKRLNPYIEIDGTPFSIPTVRQSWPASGRPRTAGVSSFGFGGTNAHVLVREAEPVLAPIAEADIEAAEQLPQVLALSTKTANALRDLAGAYLAHLEAHPDASIGDVCFFANTGRAHFRHRCCVVAESSAELRGKLAAISKGEQAAPALTTPAPSLSPCKVAFLFSGEGSQYPGMGRELFQTQRHFRRTLQECDSILRPNLDAPLLDVLYGTAGELLDETAYAQPALFALEYALAALWQSWGIKPATVMGHGLGEYVAACVAGVFSLEDGLKLVAERARLMQAAPGRAQMVAALATQARVGEIITSLSGDLSIAAVNGPRNTVISGSAEGVAAAVELFAANAIATERPRAAHVVHSALMAPLIADLERAASTVTYRPPHIDLISNPSGTLAGAELTTPDYWCRQLREPVQFAAGIETIAQRGHQICLELGPHPVLTAQGRECLAHDSDFAWLPSLRCGHSDRRQMLDSLAALYIRGAPVDWRQVHGDGHHRRLRLPTYPFQRQRFWVPPPLDVNEGVAASRKGATPTAIAMLLERGDAEALARRVAQAAELAPDQFGVLGSCMRALVDQYRKEARFAGAAQSMVLSDFISDPRPNDNPPPAGADLTRRLHEAAESERRNILISHIQAEVSEVLGVPAGCTLDMTQGFFDMGFDSLMALELKNRLDATVGRLLPPTLVFDFPSIASIASHLLELLAATTAPTPPHPAATPEETMVEIAQLSETELESFVDHELRRSLQ
jgi:acyl transferase domain-containing protein/acyl-CoA synthetase (AMP-forming)/AMP-acid ligase II/acyl carrier protein